MPNWKKVVTSGSNAELQSINVSENVAITGSLYVSSSINTSTSELYSGSTVVLDWDLHQLKSNNIPSIEWDERKLYDASAEDSLDWHNRQLIGTDENVMLNWSGSSIHASASIYMSASTQLYGTASYALTASRSDASTTSVSSSITLQTDPGTYPLVYVTGTGNNPLHISPYGAVYNTENNSISNISSVSASGGFFGTASYARQSLSSSYALTASYVAGVSTPTLQQVTTQGNTTTNNVIISASLIVSNSIDSNIRNLYDTATTRSIDWTARQLFNETGTIVNVDYSSRQLKTAADEVSVDWESYQLKNSSTNVTVDWENATLSDVNNGLTGTVSVDWVDRTLIDVTETVSVDWENRNLIDTADVICINWEGRTLYDTFSSASIDWGLRTLKDENNNTKLYWALPNQLILSASNLYVKGITTGSTSNVLTYNPTTGQVYYTASAAIGDGGSSGPETDPIFTAWSGSVTSQFSGTSSFATTASYAVTASGVDVVDFGSPIGPYAAVYKVPFVRNSGSGQTLYVDNDLYYNGNNNILFTTSSHSENAINAISAQTSSKVSIITADQGYGMGAPYYIVLSQETGSQQLYNDYSLAYNTVTDTLLVTASNALTSSFVTASNVFGPFGSGSILSASFAQNAQTASFATSASYVLSSSYAVTASYVPGIGPGGPNFAVQFNNDGAFDGKEAFIFNPNSSSLGMGYDVSAFGHYSTALGFGTTASGTGSLASGFYAAATNTYASAFGDQTDATGYASFATGIGTLATKSASFATGKDALARGNFSSAHGFQTQTDADASFVVGKFNKIYFNNTGGSGSFVVGAGTNGGDRSNYFEVMPELGYVSASGDFYNKEDVYFPGLPVTSSLPLVGIRASDGRLYRIGKVILGTGGVAVGSDAISGGKDTQAIGDQGFSIGDATIANGTNAVSTGKDTNAVGSGSLTTGDTTTAVGDNSVATGKDTVAVGTSSLATGKGTVASGSNAVATGRDTIASGSNSMTAGSGSKADAENSVAFGKGTIAKTEEQVVIGRYNTADTQSLFVVGAGTDDTNRKTIMKVDSVGARIDGSMTISGSSTFTNIGPAVFSGSIVQESATATGIRSVALGSQTEAFGDQALAYGFNTTALGDQSIAGGYNTVASGAFSVALGINTYAAQNASLAFGGYSRTNGLYSIAAGLRVTSSGLYQVVVGKDNIELSDTAAFIVGNGTNNAIRSNLLVASGDVVQVTGSLNINGNAVANSFTGSLLGNVIGTSSWASNATTSSFASTASFVNTLNQNVTISGSLNISGSILPSNRKLYYSDGTVSVDWEASETYDSHGNNKSIEWDNRILRDASGVSASVDWGGRRLHDSNGTRRLIWNTSGVQVSGSLNVTGSVIAPTFTGSLQGHVVTSSINTAQSLLFNGSGQAANWGNSILIHSNITSVDWSSRILVNSSSNTTVNWQSGILSDNSGNTSVNWIDRTLKDVNAVTSVNYSSRFLYSSTSDSALDFSTKNKLTGYGAISTVLDSAFLSATEDTASINYYAGELYDGSYAIPGVTYGELLYLDYSTNEWVNIDQTTDSCTRYLGIDLKNKDGVLTEGYILMTDDAAPFHSSMPRIANPLIGMPVYIKESASGDYRSYTCDIPASGYVRAIGHVVYQSPAAGFETKYMIKFKPSNDWYEI